jgi:hypothetical protein
LGDQNVSRRVLDDARLALGGGEVALADPLEEPFGRHRRVGRRELAATHLSLGVAVVAAARDTERAAQPADHVVLVLRLAEPFLTRLDVGVEFHLTPQRVGVLDHLVRPARVVGGLARVVVDGSRSGQQSPRLVDT